MASSAALLLAAGLGDANEAAAQGVHVTAVRGRLRCAASTGSGVVPFLPQVAVDIGGRGKTSTADDGTFTIRTPLSDTKAKLRVVYSRLFRASATRPGLLSELLVMNDLHNAHYDEIDVSGTVRDGTLDVGDVTFSSLDCDIWRVGVDLVNDYHQLRAASADPRVPGGQLRIKRFDVSDVGVPYTLYDYIVTRKSFGSDPDLRGTLFHEFGHVIRDIADGDLTHWNGDNAKWTYGRVHHGDEVTTQQFAFHEGWGNYWRAARLAATTTPRPAAPATYRAPLAAGYRDWNEILVANALLALAGSAGGGDAGDRAMLSVLEKNPGGIHTLHEFEVAFAKQRGLAEPPAPAACPPEFHDDGATCRRDVDVTAKPSYGRGVGEVPSSCADGWEYDAGLCYPMCPAGYRGIGPVCWQICPAGYHDDGATCRLDAQIFSADNSQCPWYDKCGLTFSKGCSVCPAGFANDGCTCRRDASIFGKSTQTRGAGKVPIACRPGTVYDAGLCYTPCNAGYTGAGPVCWGSCPADHEDHGATCYRAASVFGK
jgi:hypothetical protein